jgi:hypothetical protein
MFLTIYVAVARLSRILEADDLRYVARWFTFRLR